MNVPTPRDVAEAREAARILRELDALVRDIHIGQWNEQIETAITALNDGALDGHGAVIEFSYTDNVVRAFPEPRLRPGTAVLFNLDTGVHHYRDINPAQIRSTP